MLAALLVLVLVLMTMTSVALGEAAVLGEDGVLLEPGRTGCMRRGINELLFFPGGNDRAGFRPNL